MYCAATHMEWLYPFVMSRNVIKDFFKNRTILLKLTSAKVKAFLAPLWVARSSGRRCKNTFAFKVLINGLTGREVEWAHCTTSLKKKAAVLRKYLNNGIWQRFCSHFPRSPLLKCTNDGSKWEMKRAKMLPKVLWPLLMPTWKWQSRSFLWGFRVQFWAEGHRHNDQVVGERQAPHLLRGNGRRRRPLPLKI